MCCDKKHSLAPKVQNDSATPGHIHAQPAISINLHRLAPCDVMQDNRLPIIQFVVIAVPVEADTRNSIAAIRHQTLQLDGLAKAAAAASRWNLEGVSFDRPRVVVGVIVTGRGIILHQVYHHEFAQSAASSVRGVGALLLTWQRQVDHAWRRLCEVSEEGCDADVAVVRRFRAFAGLVRIDRLPALISVVGPLVHVDAPDVIGGAVQIEVDPP